LCWRARCAISAFQQRAARTPWCLFSVILIPFPLLSCTMSGSNTKYPFCCYKRILNPKGSSIFGIW
jgi:hypothetical protein